MLLFYEIILVSFDFTFSFENGIKLIFFLFSLVALILKH